MARSIYLFSLALLIATLTVADGRMMMPDKRDGSTITVETTQFNPALTNQGGTTNLAGTFNVSPLATSTSYAFQTVVQTSTFAVNGAAPTAASNGNSNSDSDGGSGSENLSSDAGNTVVITSTASTTMTVGTPSSTSQASVSGASGASNGLPTLALGTSQNAAFSLNPTNFNTLAAGLVCFFSTSLLASCILL